MALVFTLLYLGWCIYPWFRAKLCIRVTSFEATVETECSQQLCYSVGAMQSGTWKFVFQPSVD